MKVTVELSDQEMAEILELTGERKKGPAIRRLMEEALQQRRRAQIAQRFLSGEWGVELETRNASACGRRRSLHDAAARYQPLDRFHPDPQPGGPQAAHCSQFDTLPLLATPADLWQQAINLGQACCQIGRTVLSLDLLIAAIALHHNAVLVSFDADFEAIAAVRALRLHRLSRPG